MILAACVDEAMGLRFGGRRQSRDRLVSAELIALSEGRLRICPSSASLFPDFTGYAGEDYLSAAADGDWCFAEDTAYLEYADRIEKIVLFQWNRSYPSDLSFRFPGKWVLESKRSFPGSSHKEITVEVYIHEP